MNDDKILARLLARLIAVENQKNAIEAAGFRWLARRGGSNEPGLYFVNITSDASPGEPGWRSFPAWAETELGAWNNACAAWMKAFYEDKIRQ